jgi:hypothetical protein
MDISLSGLLFGGVGVGDLMAVAEIPTSSMA